MKKCPMCAEEIQDEAVKCKHCGEMLSGAGSPPPSAVPHPLSAAAGKEATPKANSSTAKIVMVSNGLQVIASAGCLSTVLMVLIPGFGFIIGGVIVICAIVGSLFSKTARYEGNCPHCGRLMNCLDIPAFDCPVCKKRIALDKQAMKFQAV